MKKLTADISGFTLIEMIVAIVVIGIIAAVAMQSMTATVDDIRTTETEREMEMLAAAIVGDPSVRMAGTRADFGYVGDIGSFPPNLQALSQNPGGYSTWDGPYIAAGFTEDANGYNIDSWGAAYSYSGGTSITSTGSGSDIIKKIADASSDYLTNTFNGEIRDANDSVPGNTFMDSVDIEIVIPNGMGSTTTNTYAPDSAGAFTLNSLPVGTHPLRFIFTPANDTVMRYLTVLPRHKSSKDFKFASAHFAAAPPTAGADTLRPNGVGAISDLITTGCGSNYQCVDEEVSDGNSTQVSKGAGSYSTDVYALEDPVDTSGTITRIRVYCRARKSGTTGNVRPSVYASSTEFNGGTQNLTDAWVDYSFEWTTNPATGTAWTWQEIIDLQAGQALDGQNNGNPAYCTQVWVIVDYTN